MALEDKKREIRIEIWQIFLPPKIQPHVHVVGGGQLFSLNKELLFG